MYRKHYIRFFISSTFVDMEKERNWLAEIFARLKAEYQDKEGWQIEFVDLRWGVNGDAANDNATMSICRNELNRCRTLSPRPNFIVLLGERYGWIPLPDSLPERIGNCLKYDDDFKLFYRFDSNNLTLGNNGTWILQPYSNIALNADEISAAEKRLSDQFNKIQRITDFFRSDAMPMSISATEHEVRMGALETEDAKEHVVAYFRHLSEVPARERETFCPEDGRKNIKKLKDKLRSKLAEENIIESNISFTEYHSDNYSKKAKTQFEAHIRRVIDNEIRKTKALQPSRLSVEREIKTDYRRSKTEGFAGRDAELDEILNFITSDTDRNVMWIDGSHGAGKSALMAQAFVKLCERNESKVAPHVNPYYYRCGLTTQTSTAEGLFELIYADIYEAYKNIISSRDSFKPSALESKETHREFKGNISMSHLITCTNQKGIIPFVCFIDGYDLLQKSSLGIFSELNIEGNRMGGKHLYRSNAANTKFIISSCQPCPVTETDTIRTLTLHPFNEKEAYALFNRFLNANHHSMTEQQSSVIRSTLKEAVCTPYYIRLLANHVSRFTHSWTPLQQLPPSFDKLVEESIAAIIRNCHHDRNIVWLTLAILATCEGINESELIDILSSDKEIMSTFLKTSKHETTCRKLPPVLWHRLAYDLHDIIDYNQSHYGEVVMLHSQLLRNIIRRNCMLMVYAGTSFLHHAEHLQYDYYSRLLSKGNLHALYEMPRLVLSVKGYEPLRILLCDLRYSARMAELFSNRLDEAFSWLISSNNHLFPQHVQNMQQVRNWIMGCADMKAEQIMHYALSQPESSDVSRLCKNDYSIANKNLSNILRNTTGFDAVVYHNAMSGYITVGMSNDASKLLYCRKTHNEVIVFDRKHWKKYEYNAGKKITQLHADSNIDNIVLSFSDNRVSAYSISLGKNLIEIDNKGAEPNNLRISHDGKMIAYTIDNYLYVMDIASRSWLYCDKVYDGEKVGSICFSHNDSTIWLAAEHFVGFLHLNGDKRICSYNFQPMEGEHHIFDCISTKAIIRSLHSVFFFNIKDKDDMYVNSIPFFVDSIAGQGPGCAYIEADKTSTVSMNGMLCTVDENGIKTMKNAPFFSQMSDDRHLGLDNDGNILDIETALRNFNISEGGASGIAAYGVNSLSADASGTLILCSAGKHHIESTYHAMAIKARTNGYAPRIFMPPYSNKPNEVYKVHGSSVSPDGTRCFFSSGGTCLTTDNEMQRIGSYNISLEEGDDEAMADVRVIRWSDDSRYVAGAVQHHIAEARADLYLFNRNGCFIRRINSHHHLSFMERKLYVTPDNRYALQFDCGELLRFDLIENEELPKTTVKRDTFFFNTHCILHPCGSYVYLSNGKEIYITDITARETKLLFVADHCRELLAASPSGRYLFITESKDDNTLVEIDLSNYTRRRFPIEAHEVICTSNDDYIYVISPYKDIMLVDRRTAQVTEKTYAQVIYGKAKHAAGKLVLVEHDGRIILLKPRNVSSINSFAYAKALSRWNLETRELQPQTIVCPFCGNIMQLNNKHADLLSKHSSTNLIPYDTTAAADMEKHKLSCPKCRGTIIVNYY